VGQPGRQCQTPGMTDEFDPSTIDHEEVAQLAVTGLANCRY
jgi:hypothetical protein